MQGIGLVVVLGFGGLARRGMASALGECVRPGVSQGHRRAPAGHRRQRKLRGWRNTSEMRRWRKECDPYDEL